MDENLLGYLLDALDPEARQEVEGQMAARPELSDRLRWLRRTLEPLAADAEPPEPPAGLAIGAIARVAEYKCRKLSPPPPAPIEEPAPVAAPTAAVPAEEPQKLPLRPQRRRFVPRADLLVAACLLIVLIPLGVVGLSRLWSEYATRSACANNLRVLGGALQRYADVHQGQFPQIEESGSRSVAGVFIPILYASGSLTPDVNLRCPGDSDRTAPVPVSLQELDELYQRSPEQFNAAAGNLAGSYAYSMGYRDGGVLWGLCRSDPENLPILADGLPPAAEGNCLYHGGSGQNVLYVGGHVRWCSQRTVGVDGDDIYLNRHSEVGAGICREDTVLGCSGVGPQR